jgi:hypothetical protein
VVGGSNVVFPVQLEYARTRLFVGADGGYVLDLDDTDLWYVNVYGGWNASDSLQLLGEVWSGQSTLDRRVEIGLTFGLDWTTRSGMHLLAAGGPGIAASPGRRVRWHFYVGLQWNFALWSRD